MRVSAMTGLPIITLGSETIRGSLITYLPIALSNPASPAW